MWAVVPSSFWNKAPTPPVRFFNGQWMRIFAPGSRMKAPFYVWWDLALKMLKLGELLILNGIHRHGPSEMIIFPGKINLHDGADLAEAPLMELKAPWLRNVATCRLRDNAAKVSNVAGFEFAPLQPKVQTFDDFCTIRVYSFDWTTVLVEHLQQQMVYDTCEVYRYTICPKWLQWRLVTILMACHGWSTCYPGGNVISISQFLVSVRFLTTISWHFKRNIIDGFHTFNTPFWLFDRTLQHVTYVTIRSKPWIRRVSMPVWHSSWPTSVTTYSGSWGQLRCGVRLPVLPVDAIFWFFWISLWNSLDLLKTPTDVEHYLWKSMDVVLSSLWTVYGQIHDVSKNICSISMASGCGMCGFSNSQFCLGRFQFWSSHLRTSDVFQQFSNSCDRLLDVERWVLPLPTSKAFGQQWRSAVQHQCQDEPFGLMTFWPWMSYGW